MVSQTVSRLTAPNASRNVTSWCSYQITLLDIVLRTVFSWQKCFNKSLRRMVNTRDSHSGRLDLSSQYRTDGAPRIHNEPRVMPPRMFNGKFDVNIIWSVTSYAALFCLSSCNESTITMNYKLYGRDFRSTLLVLEFNPANHVQSPLLAALCWLRLLSVKRWCSFIDERSSRQGIRDRRSSTCGIDSVHTTVQMPQNLGVSECVGHYWLLLDQN